MDTEVIIYNISSDTYTPLDLNGDNNLCVGDSVWISADTTITDSLCGPYFLEETFTYVWSDGYSHTATFYTDNVPDIPVTGSAGDWWRRFATTGTYRLETVSVEAKLTKFPEGGLGGTEQYSGETSSSFSVTVTNCENPNSPSFPDGELPEYTVAVDPVLGTVYTSILSSGWFPPVPPLLSAGPPATPDGSITNNANNINFGSDFRVPDVKILNDQPIVIIFPETIVDIPVIVDPITIVVEELVDNTVTANVDCKCCNDLNF